MELQTISQISKEFHLSTRTLRYYEQMGLIQSDKKEDYAYRVYSPDTVARLQQIVILRKLRIPIKEIAQILQSKDATAVVETFQRRLSEIDEEITALSTIRDIVSTFITHLNESMDKRNLNLLDDQYLVEAVDLLSIQKTAVKKQKTTEDLMEASEQLMKLTDNDVRFINLPNMTVASIFKAGQDEKGNHAEFVTEELMKEFVKKNKLSEVYPEARCFGFNSPDGVPDDDPAHGYERWVTIPEQMEVSAPFIKKHLEGGLYAAHAIADGDWDNGWMPLHSFVNESQLVDFRWGTIEGVCGWLEEKLNFFHWDELDDRMRRYDLLMPVQKLGK